MTAVPDENLSFRHNRYIGAPQPILLKVELSQQEKSQEPLQSGTNKKLLKPSKVFPIVSPCIGEYN
jgi:hypothetical protein